MSNGRRILFLDDDPTRGVEFLTDNPDAVWVETVADCIRALREPWDEVHLDHDLGGEHFVDHDRDDCGMAVVRWLCEEPRPHLRSSLFRDPHPQPGRRARHDLPAPVDGLHRPRAAFRGSPPPPQGRRPAWLSRLVSFLTRIATR